VIEANGQVVYMAHRLLPGAGDQRTLDARNARRTRSAGVMTAGVATPRGWL